MGDGDDAMSALFPLDRSWAGDPLRPGLDTVAPAEMIAELSREDRERRVQALADLSERIVEDALAVYFQRHELTATCLLWSGGNDSNVLAHLMRHRATQVVHANTGIGIEATREHVRASAAAWNLPLIEREPEPQDRYESFVLQHGFPGPGQHGRMYERLKERTFESVRNQFNPNPHKQRVLFLAGRRRAESKIRAGNKATGQLPIPHMERKGSLVWAAPLSMWTKLDLNTYRSMYPDVPRNWVADLLHMSGECLCGSKARQGELEHLRTFFPDVAAYLDDLGARARANGVDPDKCTWGWGWDQMVKQRVSQRARLSDLCSSCPVNLFGSEQAA